MSNRKPETDLHQTLSDVLQLLERNRVLQELAHRQDTPNRDVVERLQQRQNLVEVQRRIATLHPADLAFVLESLPREDRVTLWDQIEPTEAAEALVEIEPTVREALIGVTDRRRLRHIIARLDLDDLAWIADDVPDDILQEVRASLADTDQQLLEQSIAYPERSVGELLTRDLWAVRESQTVSEVLAALRVRGALPEHSDRIFVVDGRNVLKGVVSTRELLLAPPEAKIDALMEVDPLRFRPEDEAEEAAKAFERYDLLAAPVVNERGKLIGQLTVDAIMDFIREAADAEALARAGLRGGEDLFAPISASTKNRTPWLFVNLLTAFAATRVIGLFESTIQDMVALATLMPIVASIGGNTGNQTVALVIRGFAFDQVTRDSIPHLIRKELLVSLLNGVIWGSLVGLGALALYGQWVLGIVMTGAVVINLVVAAAAGVAVPLALERLGRDPAQGSSVLVTFITDSTGFFAFLGLARLFL